MMAAQRLHLNAYAKINWFLHIVGRRADGYHLIESVFQLIELADHIKLIEREDGKIMREDHHMQKLPTDDLCIRAAHALKVFAKPSAGAIVLLTKNIPQQAGLGGGSSDAAAILLGLNRLWQLNLHFDQLNQIGLSLGADVPFFLSQHVLAWVSGVGECIQALTPTRSQALAILNPHISLSTQAVFQHYAKTNRNFTATLPSDCLTHTSNFDHLGTNDLESSALTLCPELGELLQMLEKLRQRYPETSKAQMSGSGSAYFLTHPLHWNTTQKQQWRNHFASKAEVIFTRTLTQAHLYK